MLNKWLTAIAAFAKANPAIVSWVLTIIAGVAARYGFHVSATGMLVVLTEVATILHAYVHVATKTPKAPKDGRAA